MLAKDAGLNKHSSKKVSTHFFGTENGESHFFVFHHFFFFKYSDCLSALYSLISSHWSTEKSAGPVAGSREETFIRSYIYILVGMEITKF